MRFALAVIQELSIVDAIVAVAMVLLWSVVVWQDWTTRQVCRTVLVLLLVGALIGRPWPWWILGAAMLASPRQWVMIPAMLAFVVGGLTGQYVPTVVFVVSALGWVLGYWGGGDGIVLLALALRYDLAGLIGIALGGLIGGLVWMYIRKRPLLGLFVAAQNIHNLQPEEAIPPASEMPAAVPWGLAGLLLEVMVWVLGWWPHL